MLSAHVPATIGAKPAPGPYLHGIEPVADVVSDDDVAVDVSDIERGARNPSIAIVEKLAVSLGVSASDLLR